MQATLEIRRHEEDREQNYVSRRLVNKWQAIGGGPEPPGCATKFWEDREAEKWEIAEASSI